LRGRGAIYGCNALYRDFAPNVLVSTDPPISTEIQNSGYSKNHTHYTRKPLPESGSQRIPPKYFGFSSGPVAVGLATEDRNRQIYLLGFDLGPNRTGSFNNMYADTEFYKKTGSQPTYAGNWINQLIKIAKNYPNIEFCRVHGDTTSTVDEFSKISNIRRLSISEFVQQYNC
jgi:hypothetical protein